ncbi:MAG: metallophosphoesterase family protein [Bacillota bacterium]
MKIIHTGDWHLYYDNYGKPGPDGVNSRYHDYVRSMWNIVDYAVMDMVDLFLIAGDLFKSSDSSGNTVTRQELAIVEGLRRLSQCEIPVVIIPGTFSHDGTLLDIIRSHRIPGIQIINAPDVLTIRTRSGPIQIAGIPGLDKSRLMEKDEYKNLSPVEVNQIITDKVIQIIRMLAAKVDPLYPAGLMAHMSVTNAVTDTKNMIMQNSEPVIPVHELGQGAFNFVALGHIHKAQVVRDQDPWVGYCGSIESKNFGEADGQRGFYELEIEKGKVNATFLPTPARRFITLEIGKVVDGKAEALNEAICSSIQEHEEEIRDAVVRIQWGMATPEQVKIINRNSITQKLYDLGASFVGTIDGSSDELIRQRSEGFSSALDPLKAMEMWISNQPELTGDREELLARANQIEEELQSATLGIAS